MALDSDGGGGGGGEGGGAKRRRVDEQGDQREAAEADASRISALPDELRQRILTHLPLKDAIRTGALARGWRGLWKTRWPHRSSVEIHLRSRDAPQRELDALGREPRPRRRLERFSLIVEEGCKLKSSELRRFIDYSAECRVEDLHVGRQTTNEPRLGFHLPFASPLLARLSLSGLSVCSIYYKGAQPFHALEVIRLHRVSISQAAFKKTMALCPCLRTLDLRGCSGDGPFYSDTRIDWPGNLRSVTVAGCEGMTLDLVLVRSLRSFRYRSYSGYGYGGYSSSFRKTPFYLPADLSDLYICLGDTIPRSCYTDYFNNGLLNDLSNLTVLTICSYALPVVASLSNDGATAQMPKLSDLPSLRELQLLMFKMEAVNLADIYVFFKTCQLPNLERLFVQLPKSHFRPREGPHDEVREKPPKDALGSLKIVKVMDFKWRSTEIKLVRFLFSKAISLHKLLLISPKVPLGMSSVEDADFLLLKEALISGKVMLSESDAAATQPYHLEGFFEI
ncbi:hypothetical protein ACP70R_043984 [Stipagrostis hirtigluma subsp. patula]